MSTLTPPAPESRTPVSPAHDGLTTYWPDAPRRRPGIVAAAAAAGALAATVLPERALGVGTFLVVAAVVGTVFAAGTTRTSRRRWTSLDALDAALVALLLSMLFVRDAEWITLLCLVAALALTAVNSTRAASVLALLGTAAAVPLAAVRGLPWVGRTLKPRSSVQAWLPAARTAVLSAVLLLVFVGPVRLCRRVVRLVGGGSHARDHLERPASASRPCHVRRRGHAGGGLRGPGATRSRPAAAAAAHAAATSSSGWPRSWSWTRSSSRSSSRRRPPCSAGTTTCSGRQA